MQIIGHFRFRNVSPKFFFSGLITRKVFFFNFKNLSKIISEEEFERDREELTEEKDIEIVETEEICRTQNESGELVWQPGCKMAKVSVFGGSYPSHPARNELKLIDLGWKFTLTCVHPVVSYASAPDDPNLKEI